MNVQLEITDKKKAIFESTLHLIKECGFHGTPMSEIALRAGVAAGTIYHYFSSKDELIIELFKYSKTNLHAAIFQYDSLSESYELRFRAIWINLCSYYIQHPAILSFMEQFYNSPYVKMIETGMQDLQNEFENFFRYGASQGYIKNLDTHIITSVFVGSITSTAKKHFSGRHTISEQDLSNLAGVIWDGLKI